MLAKIVQPKIAIVGPPVEGLRQVLTTRKIDVVSPGGHADGVIVTYGASPGQLQEALNASPNASWVQLPTAGIELFSNVIAADEVQDRVWTSAKGAYAEPVAEHALLLTLALLRDMRSRVEARSWGKPAGRSLHGLRVLVVGAGGVAQEIIRLCKTFSTHVTAIRRREGSVEGADYTARTSDLPQLLAETDVVVLAAALTPDTKHMIDEAALASMKSDAVLVNIGRGGLIDTDALTTSLAEGQIHGAALDVTAPEPLPAGHPLWGEQRCIITPHTADTMEMIIPLYLDRIDNNIRSMQQGEALFGVVDAEAGY